MNRDARSFFRQFQRDARPMPLELPVISTFFPWNDIGTSTTAARHLRAPLRPRQRLPTCLSSPHSTHCKYKKRTYLNEIKFSVIFGFFYLNPVTTLVYHLYSVVRIAFCETNFQLESFISGDFHVCQSLFRTSNRRTSPSAVQDSL